jgi:2,3-bisphosphoglycerate-dependent phosphoglycerate mutase
MLDRAIETLDIILEELDSKDKTHVHKSWRLNERHYGALQGLDKKQVGEKYGKEKLDLWRKSFDTPPPALSYNDKYHPRFDKLYAHMSKEEHKSMPLSESLEMCKARVQPYWSE